MHRRNHSLDQVMGGGRESTSGGGGFSYGTTPPLTQTTTAAQQAKLQQEKQKYKERHQRLLSHGEFSQSSESLNQQQETMLTPMSSTTTLSTVNSRTPPGRDSVAAANGRRDSSYFPPTPPASIRVASSAATPRSHAHSGSQQSLISDRGLTSRSSMPIPLNGLFSSGGTVGPISGQGAAQGGKKQKSAASSIRSRFTFSTLIGGGNDKDKVHGRQAPVGSQLHTGINQMQQQQQYLQHLVEEEQLQEDAPLPPLPPPTSPAQREREWADQSTDRSTIRRRSVNSVYSETGRRTQIGRAHV